VEQRIGTAYLGDGTEVAYALAGRGPVLVLVPGWVSHLELGWAVPAERGFYEALARDRTLLRYDKPGTGLSGSVSGQYSMAVEREALDAVIQAAGADTYELLGVSLGAAVAVQHAATNREAVRRLVSYGGWVHGPSLATPSIQAHVLGLVEAHWGLGSGVLTEIFAPGADAATKAAFTRYQREAATPAVARKILTLCYEVDIEDALKDVRAKTLVLHRDRDRAAPVEQGRRLAAGIPGARFELLSGNAHLPFVGDADALAGAVRRFLGLPPSRAKAVPRLTVRQLEVAALVADGHTNRDIAERLHLTERSAESHVERIRERLGFRSRAQIAAWYATGGH
jgi:pimeloyl-ACP methyl ester carboxylesterase/DNA-binding CsgD family transcriptional regulator